jgi:hypothetical protein
LSLLGASPASDTMRIEPPGASCLIEGPTGTYCSNLIEDHNTHPRDIDRALNDEYSKDPKRRELQLEARAHIEVQRNGYFRCCFHLPKGRRPWSANYRWFGRLWQIRIEANAAVAVAGRVTCRCGYM